MFIISIADSGQQIDEQHAARIFECFYQSDDHREYDSSGTGIGLYLAKQLMELHGGSIRAENLQAGGCRFVMTPPGAAIGRTHVRNPGTNAPLVIRLLIEKNK